MLITPALDQESSPAATVDEAVAPDAPAGSPAATRVSLEAKLKLLEEQADVVRAALDAIDR
jgi:hypothetical protein